MSSLPKISVQIRNASYHRSFSWMGILRNTTSPAPSKAVPNANPIRRQIGCGINPLSEAFPRLLEFNRRGDPFWNGIRLVGKKHLDGVKSIRAPLVFLEQPG